MIDRYSLSPMKEIWTEENRFQKMLDIEIAVCEAWNKEGLVPDKDLENIKKKAKVDIEDILEKEKIAKHETVAFTQSLSEKIGPSSKYLHFGLTSSDVLDTAMSLMMVDSLDIIIKESVAFRKILYKQAKRYKDLVMIGRTHGVHAEPITLGLKFLIWVDEMDRDIERLESTKKNISYGKISGSVGTYSQLSPKLENFVCKKLKLKPAKVSNQILQRDIHAEYLFSISILGNLLEKIATEIRSLHRTEIYEMCEPFTEGQKGSSSMPHKKNPILCENTCGLSRVLRSNLIIGMENTNLWNERDISHSSSERIAIPDSSLLIHYMLKNMAYVIENVVVNEESIRKNLELSKNKIFSQTVMLKLVEKGMDKKQAYDLIQGISLDSDSNLIDVFLSNKDILKYLTEDDIKDNCTLEYYTKSVEEIFKRFK